MLLFRVSEHIDEISLYQAGFQSNRSTDDQIFMAKRILDKRRRVDKITYVMCRPYILPLLTIIISENIVELGRFLHEFVRTLG